MPGSGSRHPAYARIRESTAVWHPEGDHLWYLIRYADVHAAFRTAASGRPSSTGTRPRSSLDDGFKVDGVPIPLGARVALVLAAANRDPRRHESPDRFDLRRADTTHLSLGGGIHFCIGAPLARLELEATFTELARTEPELVIVPPSVRRPTFQFRGYDRLIIALAADSTGTR